MCVCASQRAKAALQTAAEPAGGSLLCHKRRDTEGLLKALGTGKYRLGNKNTDLHEIWSNYFWYLHKFCTLKSIFVMTSRKKKLKS